jgi:hypothetical protein
MRGIAACAHFADGIGVTGTRPRLPPTRLTRTCRAQAGSGALGDQGPFKLGDGAQHLQREHATLWSNRH